MADNKHILGIWRLKAHGDTTTYQVKYLKLNVDIISIHIYKYINSCEFVCYYFSYMFFCVCALWGILLSKEKTKAR